MLDKNGFNCDIQCCVEIKGFACNTFKGTYIPVQLSRIGEITFFVKQFIERDIAILLKISEEVKYLLPDGMSINL